MTPVEAEVLDLEAVFGRGPWAGLDEADAGVNVGVNVGVDVKSTPSDWWHAVGEYGVLAAPLVLINAFAMYGQQQWALDNVTTVPAGAWAFALAIESAGLFLTAMAHRALMAGDAALGRRMAAYGVAGLVGYFNLLHWLPNVPKAAAYAGMSVASPWLWSVWSRARNRARLRAAGLVDAHLPRFAAARWLFYPVRTARVLRYAVWVGEKDPARAIDRYAEHEREQAAPPPALAAVFQPPPALPGRAPAALEAPPAPVPLPPAQPARPARKAPTRPPTARQERAVADGDVLAAVRRHLDAAPAMGRPTITRLVQADLPGATDRQIRRLYEQAKSRESS